MGTDYVEKLSDKLSSMDKSN